MIQRGQARPRARVLRKITKLLEELRLGFRIPFESPQRVRREEVQLRDVHVLRFPERGRGLLEERQRVGVLALVVQQTPVDVCRHRHGRVGPVRTVGFLAREAGIVPHQSDVREHFVRRCAQPPLPFARHARGLFPVPARLLELAKLQQGVCRGEVADGVRRSQRDDMLVGVDRLVVPFGADGEAGELIPEVGERGLVAENPAQQRDRLRPFSFARQVDGGAVLPEHLAFVFRIGQLVAGARHDIGSRADVA